MILTSVRQYLKHDEEIVSMDERMQLNRSHGQAENARPSVEVVTRR
jgi:hypothetical protein